MANIDDLPNKSILHMLEEELLNHIQDIRRRRRIPKKAIKSGRSSSPRKTSASKLIDKMSPQQAAKLLEALGG